MKCKHKVIIFYGNVDHHNDVYGVLTCDECDDYQKQKAEGEPRLVHGVR